ncbi:MAG: hypothetical protein HY841_12555 [Bacteroidetes bacterium]|nr:hypothetical protein [Bacteroidota bacterium]
MKTKQLIFSATALLVAVSLTFTGCRKKDEDKDTDTSGAEDNSLADKSFEDMGQISNEAASSGGLNSYKSAGYDGLLSHCATVTHDTALNKITVDFGSANCYCHDGRYRRGKLFITYTNSVKPEPYTYWDSLTQITIATAPDNSYFVNDNQVIGTKNITNKGHNGAGHMNWDVQVSGQIIKANSQGTITWTSTRNREWIADESTPLIWSDDIYGVTGTASGTSANGTPFNVTITSQLIRKIACSKHFVSGTLDFTPGSKPVRHVDFGYSPSPNPSGSCDSWISVTINSNTYYKQLP